MRIDFDKDEQSILPKYTLCIIGAGAMGISIAREFITDENTSVALIESGATTSGRPSDLDDVTNTGDVDAGVAGSRKRGFGGSTQTWGGQALPFSSIDFSQRPQLSASAWPISESDLQLYYPQVEQLFNVVSPSFDTNIWANSSTSANANLKQTATHNKLSLHFSKFSPTPNFASAHATHLDKHPSIDLIINATVLELVESNDDTSIDHVILRNATGHKTELFADVFILCAGGIENPRLLLNSKRKSLNGIGNNKGMVGRYFQDHIGLYGARLEPLNFTKFSQVFATRLIGNVKCLPKLSLHESEQRNANTLNITGNIEVQSKEQSPLILMRSCYKKLKNRQFDVPFFSSLFKLLANPIELICAAYDFAIKKRIYIPRKADYFLVANIESEPMPQSRINLSSTVDSYGMPHVEIDWRLSEHSRLAARQYYSNVKNFLEDENIANVIIKESILISSNDWKQHCYGLYHHMGATRMSSNPSQGVVDPNCKVHELRNLYIAGTSVLPTGGASNPTFTALALALRLVDHIKLKAL